MLAITTVAVCAALALHEVEGRTLVISEKSARVPRPKLVIQEVVTWFGLPFAIFELHNPTNRPLLYIAHPVYPKRPHALCASIGDGDVAERKALRAWEAAPTRRRVPSGQTVVLGFAVHTDAKRTQICLPVAYQGAKHSPFVLWSPEFSVSGS